MRFPPHLLDDIRARLPISQVVGRRVAWDKRKSNFGRGDHWACCPFHGEKSPSFHAEDRKGRYHCFGCGASGDHFTFLVDAEGLSFPQAVEQLAAEAGVALPKDDGRSDQRDKARAGLHDVLERAAAFFEAELWSPRGEAARAYLARRGVAPEIQARFRIGYAPGSRAALKSHLADAGFPPELAIQSGMLVAGDDIPVSYDRFRDRIMFPITDHRGRVVAFGGRALSPDAQAKYLNSPETPLFSKGRTLYNGQAARAALRKGGHLVVVEGYIDVIACVAAGFESTVAPLGTALTEDQLRALWQAADEPILCFDGDAAGLKAAYRAVDTALPHLTPGKSLRFAFLPDGQDPDDLLRREGPDAFRRALDGAQPLVETLWRREAGLRDLNTPERRASFEAALRQAVAAIGDTSVRRHYDLALREQLDAAFARRPAARRPGRTFDGSARAWGRGGGGGFRGLRPDAAPAAPSASLLANPLVRSRGRAAGSGFSLSDAVLIGLLIRCPKIAADRIETLAAIPFATGTAAALADALAAALADDPDRSPEDLLRALDAAGYETACRAILAKLATDNPGVVAGADEAAIAATWDDAAHLRLRAGTLSIERQAAASALGRDTSERHLVRLRDIQEQASRAARPDDGGAGEPTAIVHPFRRR